MGALSFRWGTHMKQYDRITLNDFSNSESKHQVQKKVNKKQHYQKASIKKGFKRYVEIESLIKSVVYSEPHVFSKHQSYGDKRLVGSIGAFELFSILKAQALYDNAALYYGDDRVRHVRRLLVGTCKMGNRKAFAKSPTQASLEGLRVSFPHFSTAIDQLIASAALSRRSKTDAFTITPLLLVGSPGVGKTAFCQALAKVIQVPFKRLDAGSMSTSAEIAGLSFTWSTGKSGAVYNLMTQSTVANPLIMLDELDKVRGNHNAPIEPTLLSLLEPESSQSFTDEGMQLPLNCRHLLMIATANDIQAISPPLLSRFQVVQINLPTPEQNRAVIQHIYASLIQSQPWGHTFQPDLDERVVETLLSLSPRKITQVLRHAFGRAAIRDSYQLNISDIMINELVVSHQNKIGFLR